MATKKTDPLSGYQDILKSMPLDMEALKDQVKGSAELGEKLAQAALDAAQKSNDISSGWARKTISNVGSMTALKDDPADYAAAVTEFASAQGELANENLSAFAEIAKSLQAQTIEILMNAGKAFGDEAASAMQKAGDTMTAAAKDLKSK